MKTSFDTDQIVYNLLTNSRVKDVITGGIYYQNDRPDASTDEDVVINTIAMTQDFLPQIATSNVNIYVADKPRRINGTEQLKPDHRRLSELTKIVLDVLRNSKIEGLKLIPENQTILQEAESKQHCSNIRIAWNIQTD